jgi:hypothetical protein
VQFEQIFLPICSTSGQKDRPYRGSVNPPKLTKALLYH